MKNLKGWRTVAINVGIAAGTAALPVLAGVDWTALVGPKAAVAIVVAIKVVDIGRPPVQFELRTFTRPKI